MINNQIQEENDRKYGTFSFCRELGEQPVWVLYSLDESSKSFCSWEHPINSQVL